MTKHPNKPTSTTNLARKIKAERRKRGIVRSPRIDRHQRNEPLAYDGERSFAYEGND